MKLLEWEKQKRREKKNTGKGKNSRQGLLLGKNSPKFYLLK